MTSTSGRILGGHQKIDRSARRHLTALADEPIWFPCIAEILHFEGMNGPDAIKRKSPGINEPWHFYSPNNTQDTQLISVIAEHFTQLKSAINKRDNVKAAFEAAWLAHAVVDGLTPAHHQPYEEQVAELRGGLDKASRNSIGAKIFFPGATLRERAKNNWQYWGPRGVFSTHTAFEWGVSTIILPAKLTLRTERAKQQLDKMRSDGLASWFTARAQEIDAMQLYERFQKRGWTIGLTRDVRATFAPMLAESVAVIWLAAATEKVDT